MVNAGTRVTLKQKKINVKDLSSFRLQNLNFTHQLPIIADKPIVLNFLFYLNEIQKTSIQCEW